MEYSYELEKNEYRIKLDTYSFSYSINEQVNNISYAQVRNVQMHYPKSYNNQKLYRCTIYTIDGPTIQINSYRSRDEGYESQFNHYNQFIRVLHIHLMTKSKAKFRYGMSLNNFMVTCALIFSVLLISYPLTRLLAQHSIIVYTFVPLLVAYLTLRVIMRRPVTYSPELIPYHILPG